MRSPDELQQLARLTTATLTRIRDAMQDLEQDHYGETGTIGADLERTLDAWDSAVRSIDWNADLTRDLERTWHVELPDGRRGRIVWAEEGAWDGEDQWTVRLDSGTVTAQCAGDCRVLNAID